MNETCCFLPCPIATPTRCQEEQNTPEIECFCLPFSFGTATGKQTDPQSRAGNRLIPLDRRMSPFRQSASERCRAERQFIPSSRCEVTQLSGTLLPRREPEASVAIQTLSFSQQLESRRTFANAVETVRTRLFGFAEVSLDRGKTESGRRRPRFHPLIA